MLRLARVAVPRMMAAGVAYIQGTAMFVELHLHTGNFGAEIRAITNPFTGEQLIVPIDRPPSTRAC